MTSLNPLHTIEKQVGEIIFLHKQLDRDIARRRIIDLLQQVGLAEAENRLQAYPHQLSGGQRQRVMIAMALANDPDLLIRRRAMSRSSCLWRKMISPTSFMVLAFMLSLLIFIGEAIRDAFDPRKTMV